MCQPAKAPELVANEIERSCSQHRGGLARNRVNPDDANEQLEHEEVETERYQADDQEARRLKGGPPVGCPESPMAIEQEIVGDGYAEGDNRRRLIVDIDGFHERRVDSEIDDVTRRANQRKAHQLEPIRRAPQAVPYAFCVVPSASPHTTIMERRSGGGFSERRLGLRGR